MRTSQLNAKFDLDQMFVLYFANFVLYFANL